jgi:hypothetical protein
MTKTDQTAADRNAPTIEEELEARELERCSALTAGDAVKLEAMLASDLVHIHLNGTTDTKNGYLEGVRTKYRFQRIERGRLAVRVYGDAAVMTGALRQTITVLDTGRTIDVEAMTTQTWIRRGGQWLLNTCHNSPVSSV